MYLLDFIESLTKDKYLGSKMFNGRLVLGKYITPLRGKIEIIFGSFDFIIT